MDKKKLAIPLAALALVLSAGGGIVAAAHADTTSTTSSSTTGTQTQHPRPAAGGTITAISGNTITLTDKVSGTTYSVDASGATVEKFTAPASAGAPPTKTTIAVSDLKVGDTIGVDGSVSGSSITATEIHAGDMPMGGHGGRGDHGVRGTVSAVNGSSLTITGADGKTYTVNASGATASKMQTISVSDVQVGDSVDVDGTVSGTSVTATHLMDGVPADAPHAASAPST